ncbi:tetratricopeptide repeat protein [Herbidospora sp. RD11066]
MTNGVRFTDRRDALDAFDRLFNGDVPERVLVYWGVSGQGKTTLLRHLRDVTAPSHRPVIVDLDEIRLMGSTEGAAHAAVEFVLQQIAEAVISWYAPIRRNHARRRFARALTRSRKGLVRASTPVDAHLQARERSVIIGSSITIDTRPPTSGLHEAAYRDAMVEALCRLARGLSGRRRALLIDSSENLALLDERQEADGKGSGVESWFTTKVLPRLLSAGTNLRVVLAGREQLPLPERIDHFSVELTEWDSEDTGDYLRAHGLTDPSMAKRVHSLCGGVPVWTAMIAEWFAADPEHHEVSRLAETVDNLAADQWIIRQFVTRLPDRQQEVLRAAAVLRTVSFESVGFLLGDTGKDGEWYERFCRYSFVRVVDTGGRLPARRIHDLVRRALLAYLERERPSLLEELHRRAAAYHAKREDFLEEAYHRFASGDDSPVDRWHELLSEASRSMNLDLMRQYAEIITSPEQIGRVAGRFPRVTARAAIVAGSIASHSGRLAEAEPLLVQARNWYAAAEDHSGEGAALLQLGHVAVLNKEYKEARTQLDRALKIWRRTGSRENQAHTLRILAEAEIAGGLRRDGIRKLELARKIYRELQKPELEFATTTEVAEFYAGNGDWKECNQTFTEAIELAKRTEDLSAEAHLLKKWGTLAGENGRTGEAHAHHLKARKMLHTLSDPCELKVVVGLANHACANELWEQAAEYGASALKLSRKHGDRGMEASALNVLGRVASERGDSEQAGSHFSAAESLCRELGDHAVLAGVLINRGKLAEHRKEQRDASRSYREALAIAEGADLPVRQAEAHLGIGTVLSRHRPHEARESLSHALAIYRKQGNHHGQANTLNALGALERAENRLQQAVTTYRDALELYESAGSPIRRGSILLTVAAILEDLEDYDGSGHASEEALEVFGQDGHAAERGYAFRNLARTALQRNDRAKAVEHFNNSLPLIHEARDAVSAFTTIVILEILNPNPKREYQRLREHILADHKTPLLPFEFLLRMAKKLARIDSEEDMPFVGLIVFRMLAREPFIRRVRRLLALTRDAAFPSRQGAIYSGPHGHGEDGRARAASPP